MTDKEFNEWMNYHESAFKGVKTFVYEDENRIRLWASAMRSISLDSAKAATKQMLERSDFQPQGFSKHIGMIRVLAYTPPRQMTDQINWQAPRFKCLKCEDTGIVYVWSQVAVNSVRDTGDVPKDKRYHRKASQPIRCECENGDNRGVGDEHGNMRLSKLSEASFVLWNPLDTEELRKSVVGGRRKWKEIPGYSEFDAFS